MLCNRIVWSLLLLSRVTDSRVTVKQTPNSVSVKEGDTFHLYCSFSENATDSRNGTIGSVTWYKDSRTCEVCNNCTEYFGRVHNSDVFSFREFRNASISITDVNLNNSGKYYCEVDLMIGGKGTGEGTDVTVNGHVDSEVTTPPSQWNTHLLIFSVVAFVALALILTKLIYILQCSGPPGKRNGAQTVNKEEDMSKTVVYAKLNISRPPTDRTVYEGAREPVQSKKPRETRAAPLPDSSGESVVYALLRKPGYNKESIPLEPMQTRRRNEERTVYGRVRV